MLEERDAHFDSMYPTDVKSNDDFDYCTCPICSTDLELVYQDEQEESNQIFLSVRIPRLAMVGLVLGASFAGGFMIIFSIFLLIIRLI